MSTAPLPPPASPNLEAGWLLNATTRQRIIRHYDAAGAWVSLTFVTETKD